MAEFPPENPEDTFQRAITETEQAIVRFRELAASSITATQNPHTIRELINFNAQLLQILDAACLIPLWEYTRELIQTLEALAQEIILNCDPRNCMNEAASCLGSFIAEARGESIRNEELIEQNLQNWRNLLHGEKSPAETKIDYGAELSPVEMNHPPSPQIEINPPPQDEIPSNSEYLQAVVTEAEEIIATLEAAILSLENAPTDRELINQIFRGYHTIKGGAGMVGLADFAHYTHQVENALSLVREGKISVTPALISALLESLDCLNAFLAEIRGAEKVPAQIIQNNLYAIQMICAQKDNFFIAEQLAKTNSSPRNPQPEKTISVPEHPQIPQPEKPISTHEDASASIRVDIAKLDYLLNLVGESVIHQAAIEPLRNRLEQIIDLGQEILEENEDAPENIWQTFNHTMNLATAIHADLIEVINRGERLVREFQEQVMNIRMVPISALFNSFKRLIRDTAREVGKQISLEIHGEGTELDKTMIEHLSNPFKHMIRNAIDHGIESPTERMSQGKNPQGTITLNAYHKSGSIHIEIGDDGAGINLERVRAIAQNKGLITKSENLSEMQIIELLFQPGFSTAQKITNLSGRGVGLDVVRQDIAALRGTVEITTKPGNGTTFIITLPLTMAIIDGMLVRVGTQIFIIPLLVINESLRLKTNQIKLAQKNGELIDLRGEFLPLVRLHRLFHIPTEIIQPTQGLAVIVESGGRQAGLLVDEALDQKQFVIKSLTENFQNVEGIAAATILNNGQIGLILDIPGVLRKAVL